MTQKQTAEKITKKVHSVDYIRTVKEYLKLRTVKDDLDHAAQIHLAYLAFNIKADGTASVGYKELQTLRLSPKVISRDNRRFKELGIISRVEIGHANQFGTGGKVSKFHFDMGAILRLNAESADFPLREDSKKGVLTSQGGSADFPAASADFPKEAEPLPLGGSVPEVPFLKNTDPDVSRLEGAAGESSESGVVSDSVVEFDDTIDLDVIGVSKVIMLPWMAGPSNFVATKLPTPHGIVGNRSHTRLTFNTDPSLLKFFTDRNRLPGQFRMDDDKVVTRLSADGRWAVDTYRLAVISTAEVSSAGLRDGDLIHPEMTGDTIDGKGRYRKLRPEFIPLLPLCGCGKTVGYALMRSGASFAMTISEVCFGDKCPYTIAKEQHDRDEEDREQNARMYRSLGFSEDYDPVALFNAHLPLGELPSDNVPNKCETPTAVSPWAVI